MSNRERRWRSSFLVGVSQGRTGRTSLTFRTNGVRSRRDRRDIRDRREDEYQKRGQVSVERRVSEESLIQRVGGRLYVIARASARGNLSSPQRVILNVSEESPKSRPTTMFTVCRRVGDPSFSLGRTYRRLGSEHQEGQMPSSLTLLGITLESNGCLQSAEALGILITPYLL